jgi:hypothetical protein
VYGHAALTIVAASGLDADAGLLGSINSLPERQILTRGMEPDWKLGVLPAFDATLMKSPHAQRGWT